jgi:hypothetical protein
LALWRPKSLVVEVEVEERLHAGDAGQRAHLVVENEE